MESGERRNQLVISGPQENYIIPILKKEIAGLLSTIRPASPNNRVLDIGCGNQPLRSMLEDQGWIYSSLDIAQNDPSNVDYIGAIDETFSLDRKFDLLICTEVLEHVLDWNKAFENFGRLCTPQGKLLITCPFVFPLHEAPADYWRPTSYGIEAMAAKFGFRVLEFRRGGNGFDVLGTLLNSFYLSRKANTLLGKIKFEIFYRTFLFLKYQLNSRRPEKYAGAEGTWYLSNISLLQKV